MSSVEIHYTHTKKINDPFEKGWEFSCPLCGYRSRYILKNGKSSYKLILIDTGDIWSRHTNNITNDQVSVERSNGEEFQHQIDADNLEDGIWLPYHLQQQIEDIIDRFDLDS